MSLLAVQIFDCPSPAVIIRGYWCLRKYGPFGYLPFYEPRSSTVEGDSLVTFAHSEPIFDTMPAAPGLSREITANFRSACQEARLASSLKI
jgi:hypothetical protein